MLTDIVLDTNVLKHADNPQEPRQQMSQELLAELRHCETLLCVDEGFDLREAENRSIIGAEYLKHLRFGMLGFEIVRQLAASLRVKQVSRIVPDRVSNQVTRQVPKGPDRTFIRIAFNSEGKTLACHDFDDVPATVRARLQRSIGVQIVDAATAVIAVR